ncbi:MAG: 7-carboxy-7-deazaguanine synthase QueE [Thermoguttaceae bacterium]
MRIAEIFRSIQGEGRLTGVESVFVRASGCNLRCRWCDTRYASWTPEGEDLSVGEILAQIEQAASSRPVRHAVLTGGEPMLFAELIPLAAALHEAGWHITVETAGTLYLPVACDLMSISPKLSNSAPTLEPDRHWANRHNQQRHAPESIRRLLAEYDCQLKFVVDRPEDCDEVASYVAEFPEISPSQVMLMPQGVDAAALVSKAAWLEPYCEALGWVYCPRRQVEWFGAQRGK